MSFQPVLPVLIVVALVLAIAGLVVWRIVRASGSGRMIWASRLLLVLACGLLMLRPGIVGGDVETLATDVDVVFVVDTTASIVAEDWDGDRPRLDGVRADVQEIVSRYPGARYSVITFDAEAVVRVPLTTDATALVSSISVLRPEVTANSYGSSVGAAAGLLEETLLAAEDLAPDRARLVFYLGDGEQTSPGFVESFAGSAPVIDGGAVLGYGTAAGGPMLETRLDGDSSEYILFEGEPALSVIDPANLRQIAADLGVEYQERSAEAALELPEIPATTRVEGGTTEAVAEVSWIVAAAIAVLLAIELGRATSLLIVATRVPSRPPRNGDA